MNSQWTEENIPDQTGKIAIVTGANSGLGLESTIAIAKKGATVVMACRNLAKAEKAKEEVLKAIPNAKLNVIPLDNANLTSVRTFADTFKMNYDRLDILMNNAGVMAIPRAETKDGFEMQLGVNHLGHFALTGLLLDVIIATPNSRIHTTSSSANYSGSIYFDDLMLKQGYGRWKSYGQSKLANVFFANELHKRLSDAGHKTLSNSSHPGLVMTNLQANSLDKSDMPLAERILYGLLGPLMSQDVSMGILPQLFGATAKEAKGGIFYGPRSMNLKGYPAEKKAKKDAYDADALKRFWNVSEDITGVTYSFGTV